MEILETLLSQPMDKLFSFVIISIIVLMAVYFFIKGVVILIVKAININGDKNREVNLGNFFSLKSSFAEEKKKSNNEKNETEQQRIINAYPYMQSLKEHYVKGEKEIINNFISNQINLCISGLDSIKTDIKDSYKDELWKNSNENDYSINSYKLTIMELITDEAIERIKTNICREIREDHFNTKDSNYLNNVSEKNLLILKERINRHEDKLSTSIIRSILPKSLKALEKAIIDILNSTKDGYETVFVKYNNRKSKDKEEMKKQLKEQYKDLNFDFIFNDAYWE